MEVMVLQLHLDFLVVLEVVEVEILLVVIQVEVQVIHLQQVLLKEIMVAVVLILVRGTLLGVVEVLEVLDQVYLHQLTVDQVVTDYRLI